MSVDSHLYLVFSKSGTQFDVSIPSQLDQTALRHWHRQDMPMLDTGLRPRRDRIADPFVQRAAAPGRRQAMRRNA
ncbi:hypothetical protein [Paraburkholderia terrae]|uniref:hypothetical protein n=1 Tax=Paraburkholderia terrae TaxID=311230 RepID=UPI001E304AC4|nr:hypothetical protein [Paraburkholderia terrae]